MKSTESSATAYGAEALMFHEVELSKALHLVDVSRKAHHFEPLAMDMVQRNFQESMWRLIDDIIAGDIHIEDAREVLWQAEQLLNARIQTIKEKEKGWNNQLEI